MRMLRRNGSQFWLVRITGYTEKTDSDGNFTGEKIPTFQNPYKIALNVMPVDGTVESAIQGFVGRYDQIGLSMVELKEDDLLMNVGFDSAIESDWNNGIYNPSVIATMDKRYNYKVGQALVSLNVRRYGLKARG